MAFLMDALRSNYLSFKEYVNQANWALCVMHSHRFLYSASSSEGKQTETEILILYFHKKGQKDDII